MTKISIIIPTCNSKKYLKECIESMINQTFKDIEVIIVDSSSNDGTQNIIKKYADIDNRIKFVQRPLEFVGISRNAALDIATGDYIMFCDSDDWFDLDTCEKCYKQIFKNDDDIVFFSHTEYYEETGQFKDADYNIKSFSNFYSGESFQLSSLDKNFIGGSECWHQIYNRKFLLDNNIKFGTEKFGEDTAFFIACLVKSKKVSVLPEYIYNYRKSSNSSTSAYAVSYWNDLFTSREKCFQIVCDSQDKEHYLKIFLPYYINSMTYWFERWSKIKNVNTEEFYNKLHILFKMLKENYSNIIEQRKSDIRNYNFFLKTSNENWQSRNLNKIIKSIFSIENKDRHKVIRLLGIKIKIKYKKKLHINYLKYQKLYDKTIKRLKYKVVNHQKIRVAFYVNDTRWKSQDLFDLLQTNKYYEPFILLGRNSDSCYSWEKQTPEEYEDIYCFYQNKNMPIYKAYDFSTDEQIPLENFHPDIIFYSRQFGLAKEHGIDSTSKYALTCYVPYFISNSPTSLESGSYFHNILWKYYLINEDLKNEYASFMPNNGQNLKVVGHPILDEYTNKKISTNKNYVIYAPHCSLGHHILKYATFDWNGKYILDFAKSHPEIKWIFKPHPILKGKMVESGLYSEKEAEEYYSEWDKIGMKYEGPDYIDLFKESRLLITDCGSFLAEYMPTKNPVILLRSKNSTPYNFLAKKVTKYYYKAYNLKDLKTLLNKVLLNNEDPIKDKRINMLHDLNLVTNASQNIVNDLNKTLGIKEEVKE